MAQVESLASNRWSNDSTLANRYPNDFTRSFPPLPHVNICIRTLSGFLRLAASLALLLTAMGLASCSSSMDSNKKGPPKNLPVVSIHGSPATPAHNMSHGEYPFDAGGNYVSSWAAEGERIAGRNSTAAMDYSSWKSSHGTGSSSSSSSRKRSTPVKKKVSSTSYVVKKGDTLSGIARKYGTTVSKIKSANGLKSDMIRDGKSLRIPR